MDGIDPSQTFQAMGLPRNDFRNYGVVIDALNLLGISKVSLMSNNPAKVKALTDAGIDRSRIPFISPQRHILPNTDGQEGSYGPCKLMDAELGNGSGHAMVITRLRELLPRIRPVSGAVKKS